MNFAINNTINEIPNKHNDNFQVFLIHSLYETFKYVNPNATNILVGATNIVHP